MKIDVTADVFKLAQVFTISRGSRTEAKVLTVRITDGDVQGWGECVPYARYDETLDSVTDQIMGLPADITREALQGAFPRLRPTLCRWIHRTKCRPKPLRTPIARC